MSSFKPGFYASIEKDVKLEPINSEYKPYIKHTKTWYFDKDVGEYRICDGDDIDVQALIDSYEGQDMRSIIMRQPGDTAQAKLAIAVDKGLLAMSPLPASDVDLTELPTDNIGLAKAQKQASKLVSDLNSELGESFSLEDYAKGLAEKAIKDYLDKQTAVAMAEKGNE